MSVSRRNVNITSLFLSKNSHTFLLGHQYIVANVLHQRSTGYIHRYPLVYIQPMGQLDLTIAYHVEVVSFELESKRINERKRARRAHVLQGFFGSIATRTIGETSKWRPVNDGQKISVDNVADFNTSESS